ncbi:hypothetical protein GCM10023238_36700 [Streptomyces heliomycini]
MEDPGNGSPTGSGERGAHSGDRRTVTFVIHRSTRAGSDDEIVRTIVRRELVLSWDDPDKVITETGTFSIVSYAYDMTNGGCGAPRLPHPALRHGRPATRPTSEIDPYDPSCAPVGRSGSAGDGDARRRRVPSDLNVGVCVGGTSSGRTVRDARPCSKAPGPVMYVRSMSTV